MSRDARQLAKEIAECDRELDAVFVTVVRKTPGGTLVDTSHVIRRRDVDRDTIVTLVSDSWGSTIRHLVARADLGAQPCVDGSCATCQAGGVTCH